MWGKRKHHALFVEMYTVENSMEVPQKTKNRTAI
jgi:hypothetical protein